MTLPFARILTSFPIPELASYPLSLKLAKSLWRPLSQSQRGAMTAPAAVPHQGALSLPLGCLLHTNLITCLTAQLWAAGVPCPGLMEYCVPFCKMQWGIMAALWGRGAVNSASSVSLNPDCCNIVTQHCCSRRFSLRWWLPFSGNDGSPLFSQNLSLCMALLPWDHTFPLYVAY